MWKNRNYYALLRGKIIIYIKKKNPLENNLTQKLKMGIPFNLAVPFLDKFTKKKLIYLYEKACIRMLLMAPKS